jgi:hypothetical protein
MNARAFGRAHRRRHAALRYCGRPRRGHDRTSGRLHGQVHRARWSRKVVALGIVSGAQQAQSGNVFVLDRDIEDSAHAGGVIAQYVQKGVFSGDADFTAPVCSRRTR